MPTITDPLGHEVLPGDKLVLERVHYFVTDVTQSSFTIKRDTWWNRLCYFVSTSLHRVWTM
jgi:hypothetical protein